MGKQYCVLFCHCVIILIVIIHYKMGLDTTGDCHNVCSYQQQQKYYYFQQAMFLIECCCNISTSLEVNIMEWASILSSAGSISNNGSSHVDLISSRNGMCLHVIQKSSTIQYAANCNMPKCKVLRLLSSTVDNHPHYTSV